MPVFGVWVDFDLQEPIPSDVSMGELPPWATVPGALYATSEHDFAVLALVQRLKAAVVDYDSYRAFQAEDLRWCVDDNGVVRFLSSMDSGKYILRGNYIFLGEPTSEGFRVDGEYVLHGEGACSCCKGFYAEARRDAPEARRDPPLEYLRVNAFGKLADLELGFSGVRTKNWFVLRIRGALRQDTRLQSAILRLAREGSTADIRGDALDLIAGARITDLHSQLQTLIEEFLGSDSLELRLSGIASAAFLPPTARQALLPAARKASGELQRIVNAISAFEFETGNK